MSVKGICRKCGKTYDHYADIQSARKNVQSKNANRVNFKIMRRLTLLITVLIPIITFTSCTPQELKDTKVVIDRKLAENVDELDDWFSPSNEELLKNFENLKTEILAYKKDCGDYIGCSYDRNQLSRVESAIKELKERIANAEKRRIEDEAEARKIKCNACHKEITSNRAYVMSGSNCYPITDLQGYKSSGEIIICSKKCCSEAAMTRELFGL